jgi:O-acetyl-ADP-ribose deacetylase (regulator of RNase III)
MNFGENLERFNMGISYIIGDATQPQGNGVKIVAHVCNDVGGYGSGFAGAVAKKWPEVRLAYKTWHAKGDGFALGMVQLVKLPDDIIVANMIAQHGYSSPSWPAIQYPALHMCLSKVAKRVKELSASIHCPRLGAGLAGGEWHIIESILSDTTDGVNVFVYDLPKGE